MKNSVSSLIGVGRPRDPCLFEVGFACGRALYFRLKAFSVLLRKIDCHIGRCLRASKDKGNSY